MLTTFVKSLAANMEPVELSKAEEVLGAGIIPEDALSMSSDIYGYAEAEDSSFDYGFFMSIGTTGIPDTEQDDYILFSVSPSDYYTAGFTPVYYDSHYTYINGKEYCFGISDEFPGIYFCTFNKNNQRYSRTKQTYYCRFSCFCTFPLFNKNHYKKRCHNKLNALWIKGDKFTENRS